MDEIKKKRLLKYAKKFMSDIDICSECGEHAEFNEDGSECCGARPVNTDIELDDR